jgi:hypothetical protein
VRVAPCRDDAEIEAAIIDLAREERGSLLVSSPLRIAMRLTTYAASSGGGRRSFSAQDGQKLSIACLDL